MNWTDTLPSNSDTPYSHVRLSTPLGLFVIDWKAWKERPSYGVSLNGEWLGAEGSLSNAKDLVEDHLHTIHNNLTEFLKPTAATAEEKQP